MYCCRTFDKKGYTPPPLPNIWTEMGTLLFADGDAPILRRIDFTGYLMHTCVLQQH